ncbi:MAG: hypothetical protein ACLPXM_10970 [Terriglobales bacterium]
MKTHDYTWKIGPQLWSNRTLQTNKPVTENAVIVDLYDGHRYVVQAIYPAKPTDRAYSSLPGTVVQTWPAGSLPEDELGKLREKAEYNPDQFCGPLDDVVFFPAAV